MHFFRSLVCPVFLSCRIGDFHYIVCLSCLLIDRWDRQMGDFHCPVMF